MLLGRYTARPVGARVTLTRGMTDVETICDHLFNELGFAEVGFAPVTSGDIAAFNLTETRSSQVFEGMKRSGGRYLEAALQNRGFGFGQHAPADDRPARRQEQGAAVRCRGRAAGGGQGRRPEPVPPLHRVRACRLFGDVKTGIDKPRLAEFIEKRLDRSGTGCETCRIRNICSGGCYHESYARYEDPTHPVLPLLRAAARLGRLRARALCPHLARAIPAFFDAYVSPRGGPGIMKHLKSINKKAPHCSMSAVEDEDRGRGRRHADGRRAAPQRPIRAGKSMPSAGWPICASRWKPTCTAAPIRAGGRRRWPTR